MRGALLALALLALVPPVTALPARPAGYVSGIPAHQYAERRARVRQAADNALLIFVAPREGEDLVPYRTSSNMAYLTGVETPDAILALLPDGDPSGKTEILFLPQSNPGAGVWTSPFPSVGAEAVSETGIAEIGDLGQVWARLGPSLKAAAVVRIEGAAGDSAQFQESGRLVARIREANQAAEILSGASNLVARLRRVKSPEEVAQVRMAVAATIDGQRAALEEILPGRSELAVDGAVEHSFRRAGTVRNAFLSVIGSGPNSVVLHHDSTARPIGPDETIVVDIGAEVNYYSSDLTRTYPSGDRFTPRQREIYAAVLEAQRACERAVVTGKTRMRDLDRVAREALLRSGITAKGNDGAEVGLDRFMPHSVGHFFGLDVHDVSGGSDVVDEGVCFTLEPGVYIPAEGIGVRIEDDYLATAQGCEKLSVALPSDLATIEKLARKRRHR